MEVSQFEQLVELITQQNQLLIEVLGGIGALGALLVVVIFGLTWR
jgi:hypothetical protein